MTDPRALPSSAIVRWARAVPIIFLVVGFGFGSWLGRLPSIRDELGASAAQMSVYGLCLAAGSILGLVISGRLVQRFGPRNILLIGTILTTLALPGAAAVILHVSILAGLTLLLLYGVALSISDVAMNVSGANAEVALGRTRMPLMHAGYSLGAVAATALGALAERFGVPVPLHLAVVMVAGAALLLAMLRALPRDEEALRASGTAATTGPIPLVDSASGQQPAFTSVTGSLPVQSGEPQAAVRDPSSKPHARDPYSPWRDPRIILIGVMALAFGLFEGTAADWLPLALIDGRGISNELGSTMLSVFFVSVMAVRIAGSWIIGRLGRVGALRLSAIVAAVGIALTIAAPGAAGAVMGVVAWGLGTGLGWPIAISASADRPETAARSVAAVSAIGYGSMLVGPFAFGFLGDQIGLLVAFWALIPFAAYVVFAARASRQATRQRLG